MTDPETIAVRVPCCECRTDVHVPASNYEPDEDRLCDDCYFEDSGDMFTITQLRDCDLTRASNQQLREKYIAEYTAVGLAADEEPDGVR